jgi:hypothetical protein
MDFGQKGKHRMGIVEHSRAAGKDAVRRQAPMSTVPFDMDPHHFVERLIGMETPPSPSMQSLQVFPQRAREGAVHPKRGQAYGSKTFSPDALMIPQAYGSKPSSFETTLHAGLQDEDFADEDGEDEDDEDLDSAAQSSPGIRSLRAVSVDESVLEDIYQLYLAVDPSSQIEQGVTIMLRDIPYRLQVEPDLFRILGETCELSHVSYIYLPMTIEGFSTRSNMQSRNKGYCFIHFSVEATAHTFASRVHEYVVPDVLAGKSMFAARAKFQGLSMNLINLLDIQSKKWRPKHGVAHIRTSTGELACVGLLPLRNLVKRRTVRPNWQPNWTGGKTGSQPRAIYSAKANQRP